MLFDLALPVLALQIPWIHMANVLYLASYSVRDIFWLRILTVVAALTLLPYYFTCSANPLWEAIAWNALFTAVNLFQIVLLVRERWPVQLHGIEREVYERVFEALTPGEFRRLAAIAKWRDHQPGDVLVEDGTVVQELLVLCEGEVSVRKGEKEVVRLKSGQFIGEMSFLTQDKASASVVSHGPTKVMTWPQDELNAYLSRFSDISFKLRGVLGRDLVRKLQASHATSAGGAR
jgi:CRP-like cAMP-binding protein